MLHLMKLAVGARDVESLHAWQQARAADEPPLRHRTRNRPKRAEEILAGGSLFWVVAGWMSVRQRITAVIDDSWDDGTACTGLVLDQHLVAVEARAVAAFQGWRYLAAEAAPADVRAGRAAALDPDLPEPMRRQLRELCLI